MTPRIAPTTADLSSFYSLEEETDTFPSAKNLHQLLPAPNLPGGPTSFQPPPYNNCNDRQHWDNVVLKYKQQTEQLEQVLRKNAQQEQAYEQLKQRLQDHQLPPRNLAIDYDRMMPQQNQLEQHPQNHTLAALKDERDKVIADNKRLHIKINLLIKREQELMDILGIRNLEYTTQRRELEKNKEHVAAIKKKECHLQAETTERMNQIITNAREREAAMNKQNEDLYNQLTKEQTLERTLERTIDELTQILDEDLTPQLAHEQRIRYQLETQLAKYVNKIDEMKQNESSQIRELEAQLRDSHTGAIGNQQIDTQHGGARDENHGERPAQYNPLPYPTHMREPPIPPVNRNLFYDNANTTPRPTHTRDISVPPIDGNHYYEPDLNLEEDPNASTLPGPLGYERQNPRFDRQSADVRSHHEEIEELNEDLSKLNADANLILEERQDGVMKSFRKTMYQEYNKLKDDSRRKKHTFQHEVRRCLSEADSEEAINNNTVIRNKRLLQEAGDLLSQLDCIIKSRGLNLTPTHHAEDSRIEYPTFSGQNLPLVGDFLEELEGLLIDSGVPVSGRGSVLAQSLKGHAKHILSNSSLETYPGFDSQAEILRGHFGEAGTQMDLVLRLHKSHGAIPSSHNLGQPMSSIYNVVKSHMTLLKAASSLHSQYTNGTLAENPITGSYLNTLEQFLPRTKREAICDAIGYQTMGTMDRFSELREAFHQIQRFTSNEVAKHETDQPELKQKPNHPQLAITGDGQPAYPIIQLSTPGTPQNDVSPPSIQLPLPQTQPRHTQPMSKTKTKTFPFCTLCHRHHPPGQCPPQPPDQTYGSAPSKPMSSPSVPTMSMATASTTYDDIRQTAILNGLYYL